MAPFSQVLEPPPNPGRFRNVIKVDEKRPFKAPTLEESKNGIVQLLIQQRRAQLIQRLRSENRVVQ